jgi:hypothetical protein
MRVDKTLRKETKRFLFDEAKRTAEFVNWNRQTSWSRRSFGPMPRGRGDSNTVLLTLANDQRSVDRPVARSTGLRNRIEGTGVMAMRTKIKVCPLARAS